MKAVLLGGLLVALTATTSLALPASGPVYTGHYVLATLMCDGINPCTQGLDTCLPGNGQDPSPVGWSINMVCNLDHPSEPQFRITVINGDGSPVRFAYGSHQPNNGGCGYQGGFGTAIVTLPDYCRGGKEIVIPYYPSQLGTVTLTPYP